MKVWDVELGLAIHVEAPNGKYIVIDLGSKAGVSPIQALRGKDIGYMIITHPHYDHFSDVENIGYNEPKVLSRCVSYTREELLRGVRENQRHAFEAYCDFIERYNQPISSSDDPNGADAFNGLTVEVFRAISCDKSNINNFSAIVILKLGNAKVVVCGDNESASFDELLKDSCFKDAVRNAWVLVAAHHGRESEFYREFVDIVSPDITVVSDTSNPDTTAIGRYSAVSQGYTVVNNRTGESTKRYCLSTRSDGNILITFGECDSTQYCGTLNVKTHI